MSRPNQAVADIVCECGHKGFLLFDGADRRGMSDRWWLEGFQSKAVFIENWDGYLRKPADLLERLTAECPNCGKIGAVTEVEGTQTLKFAPPT